MDRHIDLAFGDAKDLTKNVVLITLVRRAHGDAEDDSRP
jgi:hypothetical protein